MAKYSISILKDRPNSYPCTPDQSMVLARYNSGCPCVVVPSRADDYSVIEEKNSKLIVFGNRGTRERIEKLFRSIVNIEVFSRKICEIGDRWIAVTCQEEVIYCHQPFLTKDPIFWSENGGEKVASTDIKYLIQGYGSSNLDVASLVLSMSPLGAPWPFNRSTVWNGVNRLSIGERLEIRGEDVKVERVWKFPEEYVDRNQVLHELSNLLPSVVSNLVRSDGRVGVDCSGGLDSTAVVYMLHHCACDIDAYHYVAADPSNEDHLWASQVLNDLSIMPHLIGNDSANIFFRSDLEIEEPDIEGPFSWSAGRTYLSTIAKSNIDNGVVNHFTGYGGDELFTAMPAQLWSNYQKYGLKSLPLLRRFAKKNRVNFFQLLSEARNRATFFSDLFESWKTRTERSIVDLSWGNSIEIPSWVHNEALRSVEEMVHLLCDQEIQPLSDDRARHQALASLSYEAELLCQISNRFGHDVVEWQSPFLDCEVVLASLKLDVGARTKIGRSKSLLKDSLKEIVPPTVFERRNKGDYSMEIYKAIEVN